MRLFTLLALVSIGMASAVPVKHEQGTLDLKTPATRVVALEYSFADTLVALGLNPIGVAMGHEGGDRGAPPYLLKKLMGITATGSRAQPSLETIAALRPDLILTDTFVQKELYPQLSRLAPAASFQSRRGSLDDLNEQTLKIGQLIGRETAARRLLKEQNELVAKAKKFANPKASSFVAGVLRPGDFTVHTNESFAGSFLEALGRKNAIPVKNGQTQYKVSLEGLVNMAPQTLVLFTAPDEKAALEEWKKNPLWQRIPAVKRGRVYQFDRDDWTRGRGPMALKLMVAQAIESRFLQDNVPNGQYKF